VVDPVRTFRLSDDFIAKLDAWALTQDDAPTRSEAIRRLIEIGTAFARVVTLARARELAGEARAQIAEGVNPKGARS
jgi:Arm DNA-binding domain